MLTDKIIKAVHEDIPEINSQLEQKVNKNEIKFINYFDLDYKETAVDYHPNYGSFNISITNNTSYTVSHGVAKLGNRRLFFKSPPKTPKKPTFNLAPTGVESYKDPFIFKDGDIYYLTFTHFLNESFGSAKIGYATSTDMVNWEYKGILVSNSICPALGMLWAPYITKVNNTYYMYVSGVPNGKYTSGYFVNKSNNFVSGWYWVDTVKDNNGTELDVIDIEMHYEEDEKMYYMVCTKKGEICLYKSRDISENRWTYIKTILTVTEEWEKAIMEAPQLKKTGNQYILLYGGSDSGNDQRIGIATSNKIDGEYTKRGFNGNGLLLLDFALNGFGCISHPNLTYDETNKRWILYTCQSINGHAKQHLVGYYSYNLIDWNALKTETFLSQGRNYFYINSSGNLVNACALPYDHRSSNSLPCFNNRTGFLLLAYADYISESGTYTITNYREYKPVLNFDSKKIGEYSSNIRDDRNYLACAIQPSEMWKTYGYGKLVAKMYISINNKATSSGTNTITCQLKSARQGGAITGLTITTDLIGWRDLETPWVKWREGDIIDRLVLDSFQSSTDGFELGGNSALLFSIEC